MNIKDYLVCEGLGASKPFLVKVTGPKQGRLVINSHVQTATSTLDLTDAKVLVNLGPKPHPGKVYGIDTALIPKSQTRLSNPTITLTWFYKPEDQQKKNIELAFKVANKILTKNKLDFMFDTDLVFEIHQKKSKYSGMFQRFKKGSDRILLFANPAERASDYPYVILHELAHAMHYKFFNEPKINSAWIRLFNTSIKNEVQDRKAVKAMHRAMLESDTAPSKFGRLLDDDDKGLYKQIIGSINKTHRLTVKELDTLYDSKPEELEKVWVNYDLCKTELDPIISLYSTKSYKETIAEAISLHLTGTKLPENVVRLVERTLTYVRKLDRSGSE